MKSRYLVLTAATALTICGAPTVNAKTKTVNLKVTTLKFGAKTISGKATPGAKIRVTRYAKTYATGKATKQGTFKFKAKVKLKGGWHYKVVATKKGYQSKVLKRYVVKPKTTAKTNQQITALQSQINALQQQLAQLGNTNNTDVSVQSSDLKNQIASLKNELAAVQAKVAQSKAGNKSNNFSKDTTELDNERPTVPFDEKTTEYYIYPYGKIYMYPDMERKGQAEILTQGTDSESKMITVQIYGHLPKPENNKELPSWYNTNYPSSKFGTMLIEVNGKKRYVQMDSLKGLAVGDSYYRLTNLPDDLGTGTMKPDEVKFTHSPMDGARWTQITMNGTNGNEKYWYYHADTKSWDNEWHSTSSNIDKDNETDTTDPFSGTPTEYYIEGYGDFYLFPDRQAQGYATKIMNSPRNDADRIKSIKVFGQLPPVKNNETLPYWNADNHVHTLPVEINGQQGYVPDYVVSQIAVNTSYYCLSNLPDDVGWGTIEPKDVSFKFPLANDAHYKQYSLNAKYGVTIQWRYNATTKTWQNMDLSK
ncbi:FlxA-like family protein [Secundilactobacillus similis]|uniref:Bacterial Ig domain-containing protein n=1 Tax=Secundilactobacillus similis DSM 23365 = JCM 2765 TaxID=1423804 RepID=A0A0R2EZI8_9LACO|nr:FlxA-like family protein [Secundilactobacillus similis]KRN18250.1 hypothetical protein FD14_GL002115 [Secundilactobacillus similis DSM 23365 = JCM 2765]